MIAVICTTRLRAVSLIFVLAGFVFYYSETDPDIMIAEDAKLVAVRLADGSLAVNRPRSSKFTIQNWAKAYDVHAIVPPVIAGSKKNGIYREDAFYCEDKICSITLKDGRMLSYTDEPAAVEFACNIGDVVVLAVAGKELKCSSDSKLIVTRRDLALKGSLEVRLGSQRASSHTLRKPISAGQSVTPVFEPAYGRGFDPDNEFLEDDIELALTDISKDMKAPENAHSAADASNTLISTTDAGNALVSVTDDGNALMSVTVLANMADAAKPLHYNDQLIYSVGEPQRPWHLYRLYSRAARGLADYVAPKKAKAAQKPSQ